MRHANVYGIDMPSRAELIAAYRNDEEIRREIGAVIAQALHAGGFHRLAAELDGVFNGLGP